jgi:hypothetical protein
LSEPGTMDDELLLLLLVEEDVDCLLSSASLSARDMLADGGKTGGALESSR